MSAGDEFLGKAAMLHPAPVPLGDQAALYYLADELAAARFATAVRAVDPPGLLDVVQAYTSVAVYFDLDQTTLAEIGRQLQEVTFDDRSGPPPGKHHRIPCCYELQLDLARVARDTNLSEQDVIRLHAATEYTVYAIGFCPGFPYLGYLPPALAGTPRLEKPRVRVAPGSVGMTGRQTGIYPLERPGGWNLIGRTPLELVNVADGYFPLRTGDRVRFEAIDSDEFVRLQGERL